MNQIISFLYFLILTSILNSIAYSYIWFNNFYYKLSISILLGLGILGFFIFLISNIKKYILSQSIINNTISNLIKEQHQIHVECPGCKKINPFLYFFDKTNNFECPVCEQTSNIKINFSTAIVDEPQISKLDSIKKLEE